MNTLISTTLVMGTALLITSCGTLYGKPVKPLQGPPVQNSETPYSQALQCIGNEVPKNKRIAIAVDYIPDRTGKYSIYEGGYKVTQGAEDIAISALGKTNAYFLVDRTNMRVPMMEVQYANKYLLRDYDQKENIRQKNGYARKLQAGELIGSDYVLTGSITEINYNLDSGGFEVFIDGIGGGYRSFAMDVAVDLRLINTRTSQIVMIMPFRKQVWGYENKAGVTRFFGQTLVQANAGRKRQEPINLAVRAVLEAGIISMTKRIYHLPSGVCTQEMQHAKSLEKNPMANQNRMAEDKQGRPMKVAYNTKQPSVNMANNTLEKPIIFAQAKR